MDQDKVNKLLEFLVTTLQQTKDFTMEQAPLLVQDILRYGAFEAHMWLYVNAAILVVCMILLIVDIIKWQSPLIMLYFFGTLFAALFAVQAQLDLYKIENAPRVYLIEKIGKLK